MGKGAVGEFKTFSYKRIEPKKRTPLVWRILKTAKMGQVTKAYMQHMKIRWGWVPSI